ncbi:MAG: NTP transferase domain-containing protein [Kordiimonas sp.]
MRFGRFSIDECEGAYLAHSVMVGERRFKKGTQLSSTMLDQLRAAAITHVTAAQLEDGDVHEDEAATVVASKVVGDHTVCEKAFTGRVNLRAEVDGILEISADVIDAVNGIDEALTIATLHNNAMVQKGQLIATSKTIPFAAPAEAMEVLSSLDCSAAINVRPYVGKGCTLIQTQLSSVKDSLYHKTKNTLAQRMSDFGAILIEEKRCDHVIDTLAEQLLLLDEATELVLIMGASAIADRRDVIPAAIEQAGGYTIHFGMPVDPGNLLLVARMGNRWILGLPGCARSPKLNGIDHILSRLCAGMNIRATDIMGMGVGGLLNEYVGRPQPRAGKMIQHTVQPTVAIAVMAAGKSSRMGETNKLLLPYKDKTVLDHVLDQVKTAGHEDVFVVTGHDQAATKTIAGQHGVRVVHNEDYASGMSSSVKKAIEAVPEHCEGVLIVLGDMPGITGEVIEKIIAAYNPIEGRNLIMPVHTGKWGNPVLWGREFFNSFSKLKGDNGAKILLREFQQEIIELEVDSDGIFMDIDTAEAYQAFLEAKG